MSEAMFYKPDKEEKIKGQYFVMSPSANPKHGRVISNLMGIFLDYFRRSGVPDCAVFSDTIDVFLSGNIKDNYVVPDVSIICDEKKLTDRGYMGAPTLICEVISPSTKERDENDKYKLYAEYGVKEYWQINYFDKTLKQSILGDDGRYFDSLHVLLDDIELERLRNKEKYAEVFKCSIFDMEVDLNRIFYKI